MDNKDGDAILQVRALVGNSLDKWGPGDRLIESEMEVMKLVLLLVRALTAGPRSCVGAVHANEPTDRLYH